MRRLLSTLALTGCLLAGLPAAISWADSLPGFTLFSGVKSENQLPFRLDYGGEPDGWDRYRLKIPRKKLGTAVEHFIIQYPNYYNGKFDPKDIELRVKDKKVPLSQSSPVKLDKENHVIEIYPQDPIPAGSNVDIMLSNVKNPTTGGVYYFNCSTQSPGDVQLSRYIGTWIISIGH